MIAMLVAAVIGQPLGAEYSSAGNPRAFGVDARVRYPSTWAAQPFEVPNGVTRIVAPSGTQEIRLWVSDEIVPFATGGSEQGAASPEFKYVDSGVLEESFVQGHQVLTKGTFFAEGHPTRLVEFATAGGGRQIYVGCLSGRRAVLAIIGGIHGDDYAAHRPTYLEIAQSIRVRRESGGKSPWLVGGGIVLVVAAVVVAHRYFNRVKSPGGKSWAGKKSRSGKSRR
jgi:hypothetical protein